jgi:hypothetical protein
MNIILLLVQVKTLLSSVAFPQRKSLHPDWRRAGRVIPIGTEAVGT